VRIGAELAAAYPPPAGLLRFRRDFTFQAPGSFRVTDRLEAREERAFEWFLHADGPFTLDGARFTSDAGGVALVGRVELPRGARVTTAPTLLTAPGQPGSIEKGREDRRGFELRIEPSATARNVDFDVILEVAPR
jgi:hypothetical protein